MAVPSDWDYSIVIREMSSIYSLDGGCLMLRTKPTYLVVAVVACAALGFCAVAFLVKSNCGPATDQCNVAPKTVVALGRIEPAAGVIDVGGTMGDRLALLLIQEGDEVEQGEALGELESRPLRRLELEAASQQWENAKERLAVESRLADLKIAAARLNVKKAEAAQLGAAAQKKKVDFLEASLALAKKDQQRIAGLSKDLATDQERERQSLLVEQTESELNAARALLRQLVRTNELALQAAALELKAAEEAKAQLPLAIPVDSLRVSREAAEAQYKRTQIVAPCKGTVLKTYVRPGETLGARPVLQMADLDRMVVVAEVSEDEVQHLRLGQPALATSKAFRPPFDQQGLRGKITRIGQMIVNPALKSVDPFAPADRHVVEVRVELDEPSSREAAELGNMQVDVRFLERD